MKKTLTPLILRLRAFLHVDPERDWIILLLSALLVLSGIVAWNVWVFQTVASGGVIGRPAVTPTSVFSQSSLDTIHTVFTDRAVEQAKYVSGAYSYTDPSATSTLGIKRNVR
jgi:hypothetical protein